ncbi:MAG: hypothetical protein ABSE21_08265 [Bryobacteraceae bacterium]|jgi:hypothetical protein
MAEMIRAAHPASAILQEPIREEARRNRRALLAVSSVCLAVRLTGAFPTQISALGITFSGSDQHRLVWMAIILQAYFLLAFVVSAMTDFVQWRHEMRHAIETYFKSSEASESAVFTVDSAVSAALDEVQARRLSGLRPEAPVHRISHEMQKYMTKKRSLYRMLLNTYPFVLAQHVLVFWIPVLVFLVSFGSLVSWMSSHP